MQPEANKPEIHIWAGGQLLIRIGDNIIMRKPHACGGSDWEVTRVGADIGIRCLKCGRRVMIDREQFQRQVKQVVDG